MREVRKSLVALAAVVGLGASAVVGCSSSNNGGTTGLTTSIVDMAVVDRDYNNDVDYQIMLWLDVLANAANGPGLPPPDLTLNPEDHTPVDVRFYNGDLYVATTNNGTLGEGGLLIFRDYLTLTDGDAADAILHDTTPANGPDVIQRIDIEDNVLAGVTWYDDILYVWGDAGSLVSGSAPDAVIDEATSGAGAGDWQPVGVDIAEGRLYVANYQTTVDNVEPVIAIWDDIDDLVANGGSAPDVVLTDDDNFLDLDQYGKRVLVANNVLYVSGESDSNSLNAPFLFIFDAADAVSAASLPDNVLIGRVDSSDENGYIESPGAMVVDSSGTLWVANKNEDDTPNDAVAVAGFFPAGSLYQNQPPTYRVMEDSGPSQAERVAAAGGALFVTGAPDSYDIWDRKGIFIFNTSGGFTAGQAPILSAMGDDNGITTDLAFMKFPTGIAAIERGTFDNFFDFGT